MSVCLTVNGQEQKVPPHTTIAALLVGLEIPVVRVAVEYNRRILKRDQFADTVLKDGDRVEIVHFVGGG